MNLCTNLSLFISSYTPLFIILALQKLDMSLIGFKIINPFYFIVAIFLLLVSALANISLFFFFNNKTHSHYKFEVHKVENKNSEILTYLLPFIICFLPNETLNLLNPFSIIIFLTIIFVIYKVYIGSNLIYLNTMLILFKYNIYFSSVKDKKIIIISKNNLNDGSKIKAYKISDDLYTY